MRRLPIPAEACYSATDWSSDGRHLVLNNSEGIASFDLATDSLEPVATLAGAAEGALSPDMRWLAFVTNETNTREVFVTPWGRAGRAVRVSRSGGRTPRWREDGRELFFETAGGTIMSVAFPTGPGAAVSTDALRPTALFRAEGWSRPFFLDAGTPYDVSPDGQQFVLRLSAARPEAVLVQNWKARLPR